MWTSWGRARRPSWGKSAVQEWAACPGQLLELDVFSLEEEDDDEEEELDEVALSEEPEPLFESEVFSEEELDELDGSPEELDEPEPDEPLLDRLSFL
jgi:hypothetical protein